LYAIETVPAKILGQQDMWTRIQVILNACGILYDYGCIESFKIFPAAVFIVSLSLLLLSLNDLKTLYSMIYDVPDISMYVCDKMLLLNAACLLTGFLQASIQCWQDI
jgi:hypothetical protein